MFSLFALLWTLVCGAVIGWLAGIIMGQPGSTLRNIVVGIVGSALGRFLFYYAAAWLVDIFVSIAGACILLSFVNWLTFRR